MDVSDLSIGGFELIEKLAEGGMGAVFKARQISLDRIVALKVLPPALLSCPEDIELFKVEARAAAKLKHDGLAQIYEAGEADGVYYFAMEFVDGETSLQRISKRGCIPEAEALSIVERVAEALDYAWTSEGLIHRDVKPSNILIDHDGRVKLIDLGLVKAHGNTTTVTTENDVMGTPYYCSPEQAEGKPIDCRSDMYALGATLYHMVTGNMPFAHAVGIGAMIQHITGSLPDPRAINSSLTPKIAHLIAIMMAKKAYDRPNDWKAIIEDIRLVKEGKPPIRKVDATIPSTIALTDLPEAGAQQSGIQESTTPESGPKKVVIKKKPKTPEQPKKIQIKKPEPKEAQPKADAAPKKQFRIKTAKPATDQPGEDTPANARPIRSRVQPRRESKSIIPVIIIMLLIVVGAVVGVIASSNKKANEREVVRIQAWSASVIKQVDDFHEANPTDFDAAILAYKKLSINGNLPEYYRSIALSKAEDMIIQRRKARNAPPPEEGADDIDLSDLLQSNDDIDI